MLLLICMFVVAGVVYALAVDVWMVVLARGLLGGAALFISSLMHTYIGEMGILLDEIRKKRGKSSMKSVLYISLTVSVTVGVVVAFGESTLQVMHTTEYTSMTGTIYFVTLWKLTSDYNLFSSRAQCSDGTVLSCEPISVAWMVHNCTGPCNCYHSVAVFLRASVMDV